MKTSALLFAAALVCAPFTMAQAQESIPTSISISSSNGTALCAGESTTFVPTVFDQFGAIMENVVLTWTHNAIPENWNENTLTYTASERVAGGEGVTFTASVIVGEGENIKTVSGEIVLKGINIDHYLFDSELHDYYKNAGIDLRKEAIAAVRTSTNIETGRPDKTGLFDGGKDLANLVMANIGLWLIHRRSMLRAKSSLRSTIL